MKFQHFGDEDLVPTVAGVNRSIVVIIVIDQQQFIFLLLSSVPFQDVLTTGIST